MARLPCSICDLLSRCLTGRLRGPWSPQPATPIYTHVLSCGPIRRATPADRLRKRLAARTAAMDATDLAGIAERLVVSQFNLGSGAFTASINSTISAKTHTRSVSLASMAGVTRSVSWMRTQLYQTV